MPAPKSILRKERRPFAPVDTAIKLYKKVFSATMHLPKRYYAKVGDRIVNLAGEVMDNAKAANSVYVKTAADAEIRRGYWIRARAALSALSTRMDRMMEAPGNFTYQDESTGRTVGIKVGQLTGIADLIGEEKDLLSKTIQNEWEKYKGLK